MLLLPHPNGFALAVKVVPGSSRERIVGPYGDGIKLTVTAAPQAGEANVAVIALLADTLQITRANVQILRGHSSPRKEILIIGLTEEVIEQRLLPKPSPSAG